MLFVMEHRSQTPEQQQVVREAISNFSRDHLGEWISLFCRRMEQTAQTPLYKAIASLLSAVWSVIASDLNLDTTPDGDPLIVPDDDGTPYECGMAQRDVVPLTAQGRPVS
jgi:hypothetical protein